MTKDKESFYTVTLTSYQSREAVARYDKHLLPKRRPPLRRALKEFLDLLPERARVLDIGCGTGKDVDHMLKAGFEAYGIDASEEMVKLACSRHGSHFTLLDLRNVFQLPAGIYDGVTCIAVLQHIARSDMPSIMKGVQRLLTNDGLFFIFTKLGQGALWDTRLGKDFPRGTVLYTDSELNEFLVNNGFVVLNRSTFDLKRAGLTDNWITFIARKCCG